VAFGRSRVSLLQQARISLGEDRQDHLAVIIPGPRPGLPAAQQQFLRELFALWQRGVYGHETLAREAVRGVIERYLALWQGV